MAKKKDYQARKYTETHASCSKCNSMVPYEDFHKSKDSPKGIAYWCKACSCRLGREHHKLNRANNPEYKLRVRNSYCKNKYGISLQEYQDKLKAQGGICAICGTDLPSTGGSKTHLDHHHETGKIREFLCTNCNRGLGHFKEDITVMEKAIQYIKTHNSSVDAIKEGRSL